VKNDHKLQNNMSPPIRGGAWWMKNRESRESRVDRFGDGFIPILSPLFPSDSTNAFDLIESLQKPSISQSSVF
jgi:hypothetical protein